MITIPLRVENCRLFGAPDAGTLLRGILRYWKDATGDRKLVVKLTQLEAYCNHYLEVARFDDYCPNGLQVEMGTEVGRLVSGVTAALALIDAAAVNAADALLVHHGYFWKGESPCLTGIKGTRIRRLMTHGISLLAYHLPLDAHPEVGNNQQFARVLGVEGAHSTVAGNGLVWRGDLPEPLTPGEFAARLNSSLGRAPLTIHGGDRRIRHLAWCTGAAQGFIEQAAGLGVDAFVSGEISEQTVHLARELGLHYFAAGHHASERYGVQALGEHLALRFGIHHQFVDIRNPA